MRARSDKYLYLHGEGKRTESHHEVAVRSTCIPLDNYNLKLACLEPSHNNDRNQLTSMTDDQRVRMAQVTPDTQPQPEPQPQQRTITLHNGQVITFSSDESTNLETIPIIDAARIWSEDLQDRKAVAEEVREASRGTGFFYLTNHVNKSEPPPPPKKKADVFIELNFFSHSFFKAYTC